MTTISPKIARIPRRCIFPKSLNISLTYKISMETVHKFYTDEVKIGKKGQITIPKKIREEDNLDEDDVFVVTHMPSGDILLKKKVQNIPKDWLEKILKKVPATFNSKEAWKEVLEERKRERS